MAAAQARIAEIRSQIASMTPTRPAARALPSGHAFNAILASAMDGTSGPLETATVRSPGDYGPVAPPAALVAFGNGSIPAAELLPIGDGSERLHGPAAQAFRRMAADAWRSGVDLKVNDGYRTIDEQHHLADELGLYRDGGAAAVPGTSTHGWGLSVDIDTEGGSTAWLRANADRYGFVEDVPGEPWHWTYRPDS
jgi:hypothetical protein